MSALPLMATAVAAICFGVASVLQQIGARRVPAGRRLDPMLLVRLASQRPYAVGLGLDVVGFVLSAWALRSLPLFVVQAGLGASLAVTAVLSSRILGESLRPPAFAAIAATAAGLLLLAASAGTEHASPPALLAPALLAGVPVLLALAAAVHRLAPERASVAFGVLAGVGFAGFALAGRAADLDSWADAASDPTAWALGAYLLIAVLLHGTSLQRGSVTVVTAAYVGIEVVVPAVVGVLFLGDVSRPGTGLAALTGFVLIVAAVLALARADGHEPQGAPHALRLAGPGTQA
ncbi:MAG: hypothetical protein AVDCRST_MAG50-1055 [uncultured Acidimicrobiales bacterium]|uniref:Integral membrane protein n=1 Tax=uncultured Acidimicrobiales bacterium TaxID=310071 RepID=A0A6J4HRF1_9ACTN|nr:MAG: hypothetical protein AVDCRST_MAG50-1055 [uncultured Acidimicrobiales bacterium]